MSTEGSVTGWLALMAEGEGPAAEQLWRRYFHRLVGLARLKLRNAPRRVADEEDVALSAFDSFCRRAEKGQFPDLADREELWALLAAITARKAVRLQRDQQRQKRGGGTNPTDVDWEDLLGREPSPDAAAEMAETCHRLLDQLPDAEFRSVALWKLEGYTVEEIAQRLGCSPRSVKRKTGLIREIWEQENSS